MSIHPSKLLDKYSSDPSSAKIFPLGLKLLFVDLAAGISLT